MPTSRTARVGIDLSIGESRTCRRGHGSAFIRQFVEGLFEQGLPRIVTDPDPLNARAVRAYEKAGFVRDRMVETPDGDGAADGARADDADEHAREQGRRYRHSAWVGIALLPAGAAGRDLCSRWAGRRSAPAAT